MDTEELIDLNSKESNFGGNNSKSGDGFIDRSKVRILLCDNDSKSSEEVFTLLVNCSYQGMKFILSFYFWITFSVNFFL